jgi:hypothetical protein
MHTHPIVPAARRLLGRAPEAVMNHWKLTVTAALALAACGTHKTGIESQAAAGQPIAVDVEEAPGGGLRAARVYVDDEVEDDEDEAIPLEDLPTAVTDAMEELWPGATWLAAEKESNEWGVEFVTVDGEHLEAEFDDDGNLLEQEKADHDDDAAYAARAFLTGTPDGESRVLGVRLQAASALPAGPIKAVGRFAGNKTLACDEATPASTETLSVGGISQGIERSGDGWTIKVLDLEIAVDAGTPVVEVEDPL